MLNVDSETSVTLVKEIHFKSILFKPESIIYNNLNNDIDIFKVLYLFEIVDSGNTSEFKIGVMQMKILEFNEHYQCYFLDENVNDDSYFRIFDFNEIKYFPECSHRLPKGHLVARVPYIL